VLIDAGEPNVRTYLEKLAALLDEQQCTLSAIVVTHWLA
jgi:glyoxylase-like metal-dependent hydrolase (beta-lactamase superfamily II)